MVDDAVRLLPGNKFAITFDDKLVGRPVEAVECSVEIVDDVAEPLGSLTVSTVEVVELPLQEASMSLSLII